MRIEELNHVAIYVKDLKASCYFYQEVLGLAPLPRPAFNFPGAWFRLGAGQELHLIGNRQEALVFTRSHHFALRIHSASEAAAYLQEREVSFMGPKPRPDGAIQIFLQDPDGYYIELFEMNS